MNSKHNPEELYRRFTHLIDNDLQIKDLMDMKLMVMTHEFVMRINPEGEFERAPSDREIEIDKKIEARMIEIRDYRAPIDPIPPKRECHCRPIRFAAKPDSPKKED